MFRVDPAKVPVRGVRARCSVCAGVFFVERPGGQVPSEASLRAPVIPAALARPAEATPSPSGSRPLVAPAGLPAAGPIAAHPATATAAAAPAPPAVPPSLPPAALAARTPVAAPRATPPPPPPPPGPAAPATPRRVINPFLSQDPDTRARRLARALISDLVVYNPAKRADGLRDGSLKILFEEEIKKCWEEYTEQVGLELATATSYFTDALNEILADGRPVFP